jgi:PD-(D/E)XK nuclease superfamily
MLADETVILEIKAVPAPLPAYDIQAQIYLHTSSLPVSLLLNVHGLV